MCSVAHVLVLGRTCLTPPPPLLLSLRYERLLRDSRAADLSDIAKLGFIYTSGRAINGRIVVVIVSRHLPAKAIDMNRVLLYIIRVMDTIVEREYSVV
jgi:hypothetical protein